MEFICGKFSLQIYLRALIITILYPQAADAFMIRLQGLTMTLMVSEQLRWQKYSYINGNMKKISDCSN
jgi:hypothetical protein